MPVRLQDGSTLCTATSRMSRIGTKQTTHCALSEDRYRTLIEAAREAIVVLDSSTGRFIDFNRQACVLFAARPEHLASLGPAALSPEYQPDGRLSWVAYPRVPDTQQAVSRVSSRGLSGSIARSTAPSSPARSGW